MSDKKKLRKIVFVAQTPPPHLGQSIMHKFLIDADWNSFIKKHIRLELSNKSDQFGMFSIKKLINIVQVIFKIWIERTRGYIDILYYPPSGPVSRKTFYKDLSILLFTRFLAKKTVFHFHADKFDNLLGILNKIEIILAKIIYGKPDLCIVILEPQIQDIQWLHPKKIVTIPNGIEDKFNLNDCKRGSVPLNILYIGLLTAYKGIENAIETSKILKENKCNFIWTFVGGWSSREFKIYIYELIKKHELENNIIFVGEKNEDSKWKYFYESDLLCLPTHNDLMPLCIIEGMMMSLPIITTKLRTLTYIVDENINGLLSQPKDSKELATNILLLHNNEKLMKKMGLNARKKYEQYYTLDKHLELMQSAIFSI
ncbi:MAG: glycosyltransferase family 4 protein [Bacteroidota bacterium]